MPTTSTWLADHANEPFVYLTTIGRVSGTPHRIEIWFGVDDNRILLMAGGRDQSDWVKNLMVNPHVTVELGDENHAGIAKVIAPDTQDDALARDLLVHKYGKGNELDDWRERSLPIVIAFSDQDL